MQCAKCGFKNPEGIKFCGECGTRLEIICPECKFSNPASFKFCGECGIDLKKSQEINKIDYTKPESYTPKHLADKILADRSAIEGERKLVTVLFADVANFTAISEKLDPEEVHQIMDGCFKILMDEIHQHEGTINQFTGDGVMALFGAPVAHEEHARRACHAALSIQKAIEPYGETIKFETGAEFKLRIGINSGQVVVGSIGDDLRMDYTAVGDTTNLADRMQKAADPGGILVSKNSQRITEQYYEFQALDKLEVKGKEDPQEVFNLIRPSDVGTRFEASVAKGLTPFVGRKNSLPALLESFEKVQSGSGQVVGIVGEAGVGKSRLLMEFTNRLSPGAYTYLEGQCLHYGESILYTPILDILKAYFEIEDGDREFIIKKKLKEKALGLDEKLEHTIPSFQDLLSVSVDDAGYLELDPQIKRERTFEAIRDLFIRESGNRPLILVIEDLHWIDRTSEECLDYLIEWLANTPIMLILLYRTEYRHQWGSKTYYNRIGLDQLGVESSVELVKAMLESGEIMPEIRQLIMSRSAGNPLFMEEFTHTLLENGTIEKMDNRYILSRDVSEVQVPDTIQGIIAARMDRLEDNLKRTMQVASVIGREFAFKLLQTVIEMREDLKVTLLNLQGLEFIYEKNLFPELEYIFKHALTQEVAYNSLLQKRRKEIHENIGQAIEEIYSERLEEFYEMLAYHFAKSENSIKALEYLRLAADKASQSFAHIAAVALLEEAFSHAEQLIDQERDSVCLDLVTRQAESLFYLGRRQEALENLDRHEHRLEGLQAPRIASEYYLTFSLIYGFQGERDQALLNAQRALEEAEKAENAEALGKAYAILSNEKWFAGSLEQSIADSEQAVRFLEQTEERTFLGMALYTLGIATISYGDFDRATKAATRLDEIGEMIGNPRYKTNGALILGWQSTMGGEWDEGIEHYNRALSLAPDLFETAIIVGYLGFAYLEKGDHIKAIATLEQAVDQANQYRSQQVQSWFKTFLGQAYGASEQFDKARDFASQGLELAKDVKNPWGIGTAQHALGVIAHASGDLSEAEIQFQKALDTCYAMRARYQLARIHLDMAGLAHGQGSQDAATMQLNKAYAWFKKLRVPKYAEKAEQLAHEYKVTLTEVTLNELQDSEA